MLTSRTEVAWALASRIMRDELAPEAKDDVMAVMSEVANTIVGNATRVFGERCIQGIEADEKLCAYWLERSAALVTALAPKIGYAESAKMAKEAIATGLTVKELVVKKGLLEGKELDEVLDLRAMTEIGVPGGVGLPGGG